MAFIDSKSIAALKGELRANPEVDVFGPLWSRLLDRGLPERHALAWTLEHLWAAAQTDAGRPTSLGRWLLARALPDPQPLLDACTRFRVAQGTSLDRRRGDDLCDDTALVIAELVSRAAPEVYLAHHGSFLTVLTSSRGRVYLVKALIGSPDERVVAHANPLIQELLEKATTTNRARGLHPWYALRLAQMLEGDSWREEVFTLARSALIFGEEADYEVRRGAVELLTRVFGEASLPALAHYHEPNDALRIEGYRAIAKNLGAKGLDLLVLGLLYPLDPNNVHGFTPKPKYVAKMFELLKPFDLGPYADRLRRELRGKQFAPLVEQALTGRPMAVRLPRKRTITRGYFFDRFAIATSKQCVAAITKQARTLPNPIGSIKLEIQEEGSRSSWRFATPSPPPKLGCSPPSRGTHSAGT